MNITYLPRAEELGYNLNLLPKNDPDSYKASMITLAKSVKEYSAQIEQLFGESVLEETGEDDEGEV